MDRILAIDYGRRRIGLAISDELGFAARGLPTLHVANQRDGFEKVLQAVKEHCPGRIVVGMPLNLDGSKSDMSRLVELLVCELEQKTTVPILAVDERLTSVAAHRTMQEMGMKSKNNKGQVDKMAAVYLLEIFLQQQGSHASEGLGFEKWANGDVP